jgi:hypothetical protein
LQLARSNINFRFHVKKCSVEDWSLEIAYCVVLLILIYVAVRLVAKEQALKIKYGSVNLVESDLRFEG